MSDEKRRELPPEPEFPRRAVTPPQGSSFDIEAKTPARSHAVLQYQALISVFDALSPAARLDFTEICDLWLELDAAERRRIIEYAHAEMGRR